MTNTLKIIFLVIQLLSLIPVLDYILRFKSRLFSFSIVLTNKDYILILLIISNILIVIFINNRITSIISILLILLIIIYRNSFYNIRDYMKFVIEKFNKNYKNSDIYVLKFDIDLFNAIAQVNVNVSRTLLERLYNLIITSFKQNNIKFKIFHPFETDEVFVVASVPRSSTDFKSLFYTIFNIYQNFKKIKEEIFTRASLNISDLKNRIVRELQCDSNMVELNNDPKIQRIGGVTIGIAKYTHGPEQAISQASYVLGMTKYREYVISYYNTRYDIYCFKDEDINKFMRLNKDHFLKEFNLNSFRCTCS